MMICVWYMDKNFTQSMFDLMCIKGVYVVNVQFFLTCQMVHIIKIVWDVLVVTINVS